MEKFAETIPKSYAYLIVKKESAKKSIGFAKKEEKVFLENCLGKIMLIGRGDCVKADA